MYSTGQAAVHQVALRPLRGRRQDPPPDIAQPPAAQPIQAPGEVREEEREEERELLAGGDAHHPVQPRHHVGREGNQINRRGNCSHQQNNRAEIRLRSRRPGREQMKVYVETLRNADSGLYSGDETDTLQQDVAEDQAQHDEPENDTSASRTEMKQTDPASKEQEKRDDKDNEASENTQQHEVNVLQLICCHMFISFFVFPF